MSAALSLAMLPMNDWQLVACPKDTCKAKKGELCRTPSGKFTDGLQDHEARFHMALGYRLALRDAQAATQAALAELAKGAPRDQ